MKTLKTTLVTEALFSEDGTKRYLLKKVWDESKPMLAIIMLVPSSLSGIETDTSTMLVLNNAYRLNFGGVFILNLFSTLDDFKLKEAEDADEENLKAIVDAVSIADTIVYASGVGKQKNKAFQKRQTEVLTALIPFEKKLHCLCNEKGDSRLQHPLSPSVRIWKLSSLALNELISVTNTEKTSKKKNTPAQL